MIIIITSKLNDEDEYIYTDNLHSCEYYEIPELKKKFLEYKECFSTYSHNIRSINGHWDDLLDIINSAKPFTFSVLALQEIWSVSKEYNIPGYGNFEYMTRDKDSTPPQIVEGGLAFSLTKNIKIMRF